MNKCSMTGDSDVDSREEGHWCGTGDTGMESSEHCLEFCCFECDHLYMFRWYRGLLRTACSVPDGLMEDGIDHHVWRCWRVIR